MTSANKINPHFSEKVFAVGLLLAVGLAVGCGGAAGDPSAELESPDPPSEEAPDNGFNPLRVLGLAEEPPPPPATVPAGQKLRVRTTSTLSTKSNSSGETFVGTLEDAVVDGNRVVFPAGSTVTGRITFADNGGRVKGVASIGVEVSQLQTPDGDVVPVNTGVVVRQAKKTHTKDAQKIGIGAGAGALIGAIAGGGKGAAKGAGVGAGAGTGVVLATHGDPAVIPAETVLSFELVKQLSVQLSD